MYEVWKLEEELRGLKEKCCKGEQDRYTIDRIFEIELLLANQYANEF